MTSILRRITSALPLLTLWACATEPLEFVPYGTWAGPEARLVVGDGRSLLFLPPCRLVPLPVPLPISHWEFEAQVTVADSGVARQTYPATLVGRLAMLRDTVEITLTSPSRSSESYRLHAVQPQPPPQACGQG